LALEAETVIGFLLVAGLINYTVELCVTVLSWNKYWSGTRGWITL